MTPGRYQRIRFAQSARPLALAVSLLALGGASLLVTSAALAQHDSVVATLHNLSVTGPGEIRAVRETQICKFCHVPHNAIEPVPLWGHALSQAQYETAEITTPDGVREPAPQPDGSSRLCLSCHDGTVALGDVAGEARPIAMRTADRLRPGRRGFLGTDLSGSHPISFVVFETHPDEVPLHHDSILRPLSAITSDPDVKLDAAGKMQCTTCHDPHSDRFYQEGTVPRFWVKPSVSEVCLTCHAFR